MRRPSNFKYFALSVLLILASVSFSKTTLEIVQSSKKLDTSKQEISAMQTQKEELEKSIEYKKTDAYVEKVARDDLNLVKPGERVFVVKDQQEQSKTDDPRFLEENTLSATSERVTTEVNKDQRLSNLKKWWKLFF
jgi:cell division protein DivIC